MPFQSLRCVRAENRQQHDAADGQPVQVEIQQRAPERIRIMAVGLTGVGIGDAHGSRSVHFVPLYAGFAAASAALTDLCPAALQSRPFCRYFRMPPWTSKPICNRSASRPAPRRAMADADTHAKNRALNAMADAIDRDAAKLVPPINRIRPMPALPAWMKQCSTGWR